MTIETNSNGGKQSAIGTRFDLIPQDALRAAAETLHTGALKYGEENWKRITPAEHINHAQNHLNLYFLGDTDEEHLTHALVRLMMAYHTDQNGVVIDAAKPQKKVLTFSDLFADIKDYNVPYPNNL